MDQEEQTRLYLIICDMAEGLTTQKDADFVGDLFRQLLADVKSLTAIIEKELTDEPKHSDCTRQFDGAGTA
jgi:hypothetical protein